MKNFKRVLFITASVITFQFNTLNASELDIPTENVFVPQKLASKSCLKFSDQQFSIDLDGKEHAIKAYNVKGFPESLSLSNDVIKKFLEFGYFSIGQSEDNYTLTANVRLLGGVRIGEAIGGEKGGQIGKVVGGIAGGATGGAIGFYVGTAIGGPVGGAIGGAIGYSITYGGEALGSTPAPRPAPKPAPSSSTRK